MQGRREVRYQQGASRCLSSSTYVGREWRPANSVTAQFFVPSAAHGHRALLQRDDGLHNSSRICTGAYVVDRLLHIRFGDRVLRNARCRTRRLLTGCVAQGHREGNRAQRRPPGRAVRVPFRSPA